MVTQGDSNGRTHAQVDVRHANWLGGEPVATRGGLYELFARDGTQRRMGEWPRSDAPDVERALAALVALPAASLRQPAPQAADLRAEVCAPHVAGRALELAAGRAKLWAAQAETHAALLGLPAGADLGGGLGVRPVRQAALLSELHFGHGDPLGPRIGEVLVLLAGRLLAAHEVFDDLARLLATGAAVVVIPAEENPLPAELAVRCAFGQAGSALPLALVHAPTTGGWSVLAAHERVRLVIGGGDGGRTSATARSHFRDAPADLCLLSSQEVARYWPMGRTAMGAPGDLRSLEALAHQSHAALLNAPGAPALKRPRSLAELDADVPVCLDQTGAPTSSDQLPEAVARAAAAAFSPARLGGLAQRSSGVVHIPASVYSAVVECFRAELDKHPGLPTWPASELVAEYERSWRGAVDAGACLLAGGEVARTPYGPLLKPTLLVNVPADSAWAAPGRPLAQIRLVRHPD